MVKQFELLVLADTGFGSNKFVNSIRQLKHHALVGVPRNRKLKDGRTLAQLHKRGQQLRLSGLKFSVAMTWYYFKREDGKWEKRFLLSTKALKASTMNWWGRRRWQIEGFLKVAKYRFGLDRFGQQTLLGVYRWLVLSLSAYLLAHWAHLHSGGGVLPDWSEAAQKALELLLPLMALLPLLAEIQRLRSLAKSHGLDINVACCKI